MKESSPQQKPVFRQSKLLLVFEIVVFFIFYTVLLIFLRHHIPDAPILIRGIARFYGQYGYTLIFLGALLEGTFMVGFYVPGSFIVLLGAALARTGTLSFPLVILFGTLGLCWGYIINYGLGRFGWYRILVGFGFEKQIEEAKKKLHHFQERALFWGYLMPSTASFLSTAAGMLHVPFDRFLLQSLLIQLFWSLLWGGLSYLFGVAFAQIFLQYFGLIALVGFAVFLFRRKWNKRSR